MPPENEKAQLLMTQPGVGPITALAFVLTIGDVQRFPRSKQGNRFMRMLLVEAAQSVVRYDTEFRNEYLHRCHKKPKGVAKVAAARKLTVRLYWMLKTNTAYPEIARVESRSRVPLASAS